MRGLFEGIGRSVGGVIGGGASGVVQGMPGGIAGGAVGGLGVGDVATIPAGAGIGAIGGGFIGSAAGAGAGFAPGFSQGYGEGYGPGAAVGGGYGQSLDDTWLGKKLNAMVKGHEQAEGKGKEADQKKCSGQCMANQKTDELEKKANVKQETKGKTRHGRLPGDISDANREFDDLNPTEVNSINTQYGPGRTGVLDDGNRVVVRPGNSGNPTEPSLDIQRPNGRNTEIRFGP